jgi:3-phenylpropionate/trans-cinnamate dioxygenase ferredoxin reductase component
VIDVAELETIVIVGASIAGGRAAEALRQNGFAGGLILIGADPDRPYERPPLSKAVLRGTIPTDSAFLQSPDFYAENGIDLRLGVAATGLDPAARTIELDDGSTVGYDRLLIATGSNLRRLRVPGADLAGVHYLRTMSDARALAADLGSASRLVVVGAGFIGLEVAAAARALGLGVTVLDTGPVPLVRILGQTLGQVVANVHREHGVDLRSGTSVAEFRGGGRVAQVVTSFGEVIPADVVVVGVGVTPAVDWLAGSGIALDNGIVVDELSKTNLPDVFAAGDVANSWNPLLGRRVRLEHYENAQNQGIAAASVMIGGAEPYAPVPSFWSDQYDLTFQYVGHASPDDTLLVRGDPGTRSFTAFYLREGAVAGAFSTRPRDITAAKRLVRSRKVVAPEVLADEGTDLRTVAR